MRRRITRRRSVSAFTLVELLVVIGIIAVLVAILLPVLSGARKQAYETKCVNNMRQLMLAVTMYENDNNQFLPWCNWGGPGSAIPPGGTIYDYGWLYRTSTCHSPAWPTDVMDGVLYKYVAGGIGQTGSPSNASSSMPLPGADMFHCPLYDPAAAVGTTNTITSYTMNGAACGYGALTNVKTPTPPGYVPAYKITQIRNGGEKVLIWEADGNSQSTGSVFNDGASRPSEESLATRHGTGSAQTQSSSSSNLQLQSGLGANVSYLDGHVEFMHASQFLLDSASDAPNHTTGPNELWWSPASSNGHG